MITRNDYNLRLFNGDVGIILPDHGQDNELRAFFRDAGGNTRKFPPVMLPEHETVFAMTVHKSQGSEFESILFILPDYDSPVLTRELIYTGITRAKKHVEIWGSEGIFVPPYQDASCARRDCMTHSIPYDTAKLISGQVCS